ncbi:MAG: ribosome recycling factor [Bdellovibrionales bacterium]|nr:ribosome recycling factor [Bdellovibrionales bacterium]
MIENIKKQAKQSMLKSVESLANELKKVRTGRAQVSMLDSIKVEYYGNPSPLNQVASVSCPDAKSFLIAPWETSVLKDIEQAIVKSDIGMTPQNDGKVIRLKLPELTEERRKQLVKQIKKTVEEARVSVRMARRDANDELKKLQKDKEISEDEQKKAQDEIQKFTDDFVKQVDNVGDDKEKELMTI